LSRIWARSRRGMPRRPPDGPSDRLSILPGVILDRFRLDGRAAIVTGAGRGIGAAISVALAEAGADVVLVSRTKEQLDVIAGQVAAHGRRALVHPALVH